MKEIFTFGHSTRNWTDFLDILKNFKIEALVDIRHFPKSKHNPHFTKEILEKQLPKEGIFYFWLENLGGFRKGGYLAFTNTKEFKEGLEKLISIANQKKTAIMCAEILWFKCHRKFVADELEKLGFKVIHILDKKRTQRHVFKENKIKCDKNLDIFTKKS